VLPQLRCSDAVVLLRHEMPADGLLLLAALRSPVGYVGALGSQHTHRRRARWLAEHGADPQTIAALHGPAGLDIGASTPQEVAVAIVAEILAMRSGVLDLFDRDQPVAPSPQRPQAGRVPRSRRGPW
jgi:xanthine dehydrogenase accessory factor